MQPPGTEGAAARPAGFHPCNRRLDTRRRRPGRLVRAGLRRCVSEEAERAPHGDRAVPSRGAPPGPVPARPPRLGVLPETTPRNTTTHRHHCRARSFTLGAARARPPTGPLACSFSRRRPRRGGRPPSPPCVLPPRRARAPPGRPIAARWARAARSGRRPRGAAPRGVALKGPRPPSPCRLCARLFQGRGRLDRLPACCPCPGPIAAQHARQQATVRVESMPHARLAAFWRRPWFFPASAGPHAARSPAQHKNAPQPAPDSSPARRMGSRGFQHPPRRPWMGPAPPLLHTLSPRAPGAPHRRARRPPQRRRRPAPARPPEPPPRSLDNSASRVERGRAHTIRCPLPPPCPALSML
jgi:hypothetical protein